MDAWLSGLERSMDLLVEALDRAKIVIERGISDRLHLGGQIYVARQGQVMADDAVGESQAGVPMEKDTVLLWLSSGKPITAIALAQLWEQNRVRWDDRVVQYLPEFGQGGKESITIRHLLTHTGGIRTAEKCDAGATGSEIIECICSTPMPPGSIPGERAAYHPSAGWNVLGELVRRIDGRTFEKYVRDEILSRCEMRDAWLALPVEQFHQYGNRLGPLYHTDKSPPTLHRRWNSAEDAAVCRPGRSGRGPVRELGRMYQALLELRNGEMNEARKPLLQPETVREITRRHRVGKFDDTFQQVIDWGFGFLIDSKRYGSEIVSYGYGRYSSDETFGHSGAQSSCAFADPAHGLIVSWAFNGMPGERRHQQRAHELNSAIYQDLGLS